MRFAILLLACNAGGLPISQVDSALGCHARVDGAFSADVGDSQWPGSGAFMYRNDITLNCGSEHHGPLLLLALPRTPGSFTSPAGLQSAPYAFALCGPAVRANCNDQFFGNCSGVITSAAEKVGDWIAGSFWCALASRETGDSIRVTGGEVDLAVQPTPPE
jgi:hypothetical protein